MDSSSSLSNPTSCTEKSKKKRGGGGGGGGGGPKLSTDPQSVAARQRRHRISDRFKILQSLVPGGSKLDTVSMLEEAIQYVKFLKAQIWLQQAMIGAVAAHDHPSASTFKSSDDDYHGDRADEVGAQFGRPDSDWFSGQGNH